LESDSETAIIEGEFIIGYEQELAEFTESGNVSLLNGNTLAVGSNRTNAHFMTDDVEGRLI